MVQRTYMRRDNASSKPGGSYEPKRTARILAVIALVPLQVWVGLAKFGQIVALMPWVRMEDAVKMKEEWENKKGKQES